MRVEILSDKSVSNERLRIAARHNGAASCLIPPSIWYSAGPVDVQAVTDLSTDTSTQHLRPRNRRRDGGDLGVQTMRQLTRRGSTSTYSTRAVYVRLPVEVRAVRASPRAPRVSRVWPHGACIFHSPNIQIHKQKHAILYGVACTRACALATPRSRIYTLPDEAGVAPRASGSLAR